MRLVVCGLVGSESTTERVAVRVPVAVGLKVTLIVQLVPTANVVPQVVVCPKSPGFVPVNDVVTPVSVAVPTFRNVTVCAALVVPRL